MKGHGASVKAQRGVMHDENSVVRGAPLVWPLEGNPCRVETSKDRFVLVGFGLLLLLDDVSCICEVLDDLGSGQQVFAGSVLGAVVQ